MKFMAYNTTNNDRFAEPSPEFERFQPWPKEAGFELVETSYFGFNIPEENINGEIYHWIHPNLGMSTGGVYIWQGVKPLEIAAEYMDYRTYMPMPQSIVNCTWPSGVRIDMIEPTKRFRLEYTDAERETKFDFESIATMPLAVRPDGKHFTQAMKTDGTLTLRGKEYKIDGYFTRDRSWGDKRSEKPIPMPPLGWTVGVFDDSFAFHVAAFDTPEWHPEWATQYPHVKAGENHLWGYMWFEGRLSGIARVDMFVTRAADGITPQSLDMHVEDTDGRSYDIRGTMQAQLPFNTWHNMCAIFSMMRWECNGKVGYGDHQDCNFNDHASRAWKEREQG
jgi:hypothetical protein